MVHASAPGVPERDGRVCAISFAARQDAPPLRGGRRSRHHGARAGAETLADARPAGHHRQQAERGPDRRDGGGDEGRARRLHAPVAQPGARGERFALQVAALRSRARFRADLDCRFLRARAARGFRLALHVGEGFHRRRQGEPRQAERRHDQHRRHPVHRGGTAQIDGGTGIPDRSVQGDARHHRRGERQGPERHGRDPRARHPARQEREPEGARGDLRSPLRRAARGADPRRGGRSRLRGVGVERRRRTGQDAARRDRTPQQGDRRRGGRTRAQAAPSGPGRRRARELARSDARAARLRDRQVESGRGTRENREAMNLPRTETPLATQGSRGYRDLHEHLDELKKRGLLLTIDRPVDKDSELHPLVRWQFVGGMDEAERKAFLFTNITDGRGRKYDIPVVVGAIAANRAIYSVGMGAPLSEIQGKWDHAIAHPIAPRELERAACHEIVHEGEALRGEGKGLDRLPIPISTPGFDSAPTLTATHVITRDPETGVQNMGTYRAALKSSDRLVVRMATGAGGAGGYLHYVEYQKLGKKTMPCAIVLGCPPYVAFMGPQKLPVGVDEFTVAGGLAGAPINVVRAKTVDLLVPAESEIVIEGLIDTEYCEPEAPFGESHGHVALEEYNMPMRVTAITQRRNPIIPSYISQVAPSESSVIKRVAYEPLFLAHLREALGIRGVKRVSLHEPLTGLLRVQVITLEKGTPRTAGC